MHINPENACHHMFSSSYYLFSLNHARSRDLEPLALDRSFGSKVQTKPVHIWKTIETFNTINHLIFIRHKFGIVVIVSSLHRHHSSVAEAVAHHTLSL